MKRVLAAVAAMALACMLSGATAVQAQPASGETRTKARELFERGRAALEQGRYVEARDLLMRSLERKPNAGTAFNLALAQRETGETMEALQLFDRLLAGEFGTISSEQRSEVQSLRKETGREAARIRVALSAPASAEIRIDGTRVGSVAPGGTLETKVDAGRRVVTATLPDGTTAERHVTVARGATARLQLQLGQRATRPGPEQPPDRSLWTRGWFWGVLGGAAVVAGGVAAGVTLSKDPGSKPLEGEHFGVTRTLRQTP
jgi:hypothetical protein